MCSYAAQVAVFLDDFRLKFYTTYNPQFCMSPLLDLITIILLGEKWKR
jgi:hypothetical protein